MLTETERAVLLTELQKISHSRGNKDDDVPPSPSTVSGRYETTRRSLSRIVFMANALPFIGFGFLDNAIMVIAGEYIDITFASAFGISTMAAAGLGNLISDVCGIGMVGYVERFAARFGVHLPQNMTAEEIASGSVRWCTTLGRLTGITVGCLLGLLPLLFFPTTPTDSGKAEKHQTPSS